MTCRFLGTPQQVAARPSPFDSAMARLDSAELKLCYSRPSVRGRVVFGGLVPYDTLWRTGANEATVLHVSAPAEIAGVEVEPGQYSLYTVPRADQWTLVINASTRQWGLTREERGADGVLYPNAYTEEVREQELARVPIQTDSVDFTETLVARFGEPSGSEVELYVDWETTRVVIPIRILARDP